MGFGSRGASVTCTYIHSLGVGMIGRCLQAQIYQVFIVCSLSFDSSECDMRLICFQ